VTCRLIFDEDEPVAATLRRDQADKRTVDLVAELCHQFLRRFLREEDIALGQVDIRLIAHRNPGGTDGALACYFLARQYDNQLLLALSYSGFFLNLFNLIPLSPFDGGRITAVLSPRVWFFGVPIFVAMFLWRPSPLLIVIAVLAIPQLRKAFHYDPSLPENAAYYGTSLETKVTYGLYYLGLAAFLAIMSYDVHEMLGGSRGF